MNLGLHIQLWNALFTTPGTHGKRIDILLTNRQVKNCRVIGCIAEKFWILDFATFTHCVIIAYKTHTTSLKEVARFAWLSRSPKMCDRSVVVAVWRPQFCWQTHKSNK